jgi:hypothetical protein
MADKLYNQDGKTWRLPETVGFEMPSSPYGFQSRPYKVEGFRVPKSGEYYLSGAIPYAWKAPSNMGNAFLVVTPLPPKRRRLNNWG